MSCIRPLDVLFREANTYLSRVSSSGSLARGYLAFDWLIIDKTLTVCLLPGTPTQADVQTNWPAVYLPVTSSPLLTFDIGYTWIFSVKPCPLLLPGNGLPVFIGYPISGWEPDPIWTPCKKWKLLATPENRTLISRTNPYSDKYNFRVTWALLKCLYVFTFFILQFFVPPSFPCHPLLV
jgi:hypothetical protein